MKTAYRPIAIAIVLTLGCGALTVVLRAFAQPSGSNLKLTLNIDGYAKLKSSYHGNHEEFARLLQQHGSAYYLKHHNDAGDRVHQKGPKPAGATGAQHVATSEIIPVQLTTSSSTPAATTIGRGRTADKRGERGNPVDPFSLARRCPAGTLVPSGEFQGE